MNAFMEKKGFYKMVGVEENMRQSVLKFSNAYAIVIFACCREIFLVSHHSGGISKQQVAELELRKKIKKE